MFVVFDQIRKSGLGGLVSEKKVLKLVQAGDLLEQIDLDELVSQVRLDEARMKSEALQDADLYVIIIIKKPLVAIRYRLSDNQIRRIQLNFRPESGYDVAVKKLKDLGLPIRDKNIPMEPTASGYLPPPSLRRSPVRTPSQSQEQTSFTNYHQNWGSQPSQVIYGQAVGSFGAQNPTTSEVPVAFNHPIINHEFDPHIHGPARPSLLPSPDFHTRAATSDGFVMRPPSSAPEVQPERPATAPLSLSQMLPPKRELPFPPKKEKPKAPLKGLEPQAVLSGLDRLQQPASPNKTAKKRKSRAKPKTLTSLASSSAPKGDPKTIESEFRSNEAESSNAPPRAESSHRPSTSEKEIPTSDTLAPSSPARGTEEPPSATAEVLKKASKKAPQRKKVPEQTLKIFEDAAPDDVMDRLDHWVRKYQDLPVPKKPETAAENLAAYAAQDEDTRMKVLDDMIVECLGDENFAKLVEDVDRSWKRIGLGF